MGSIIIRRLVFVRFFSGAVDSHGYGLWYASMPDSRFYLMSPCITGVVFIFINSSAPNPRSLGATNGLSQTTVSIARAIAPALSTSLFSFSVEKNILGGSGVYVAFATFSIFAVYLATRLPPKPWDEHQGSPIQKVVEGAPPLKSDHIAPS